MKDLLRIFIKSVLKEGLVQHAPGSSSLAKPVETQQAAQAPAVNENFKFDTAKITDFANHVKVIGSDAVLTRTATLEQAFNGFTPDGDDSDLQQIDNICTHILQIDKQFSDQPPLAHIYFARLMTEADYANIADFWTIIKTEFNWTAARLREHKKFSLLKLLKEALELPPGFAAALTQKEVAIAEDLGVSLIQKMASDNQWEQQDIADKIATELTSDHSTRSYDANIQSGQFKGFKAVAKSADGKSLIELVQDGFMKAFKVRSTVDSQTLKSVAQTIRQRLTDDVIKDDDEIASILQALENGTSMTLQNFDENIAALLDNAAVDNDEDLIHYLKVLNQDVEQKANAAVTQTFGKSNEEFVQKIEYLATRSQSMASLGAAAPKLAKVLDVINSAGSATMSKAPAAWQMTSKVLKNTAEATEGRRGLIKWLSKSKIATALMAVGFLIDSQTGIGPDQSQPTTGDNVDTMVQNFKASGIITNAFLDANAKASVTAARDLFNSTFSKNSEYPAAMQVLQNLKQLATDWANNCPTYAEISGGQ